MNIESLNIRDRVTLSAVLLSTETQKSDKPSASFDDVLQAAFQHVDHLQKRRSAFAETQETRARTRHPRGSWQYENLR
jgi:flagellar hook-basal body complex protein FliE